MVLILFVSGPERTLDRSGEDSFAAAPPPVPDESPLDSPPREEARPILLPIAHTTTALNSEETSANEDFLIIETLLTHSQRHHGGNPIGDNDDLVAALRGRNQKTLAYLPSDHSALDQQGQLLDRWGTPYHFHTLSGTHMEIRSAGPDHALWTKDDLVHNADD